MPYGAGRGNWDISRNLTGVLRWSYSRTMGKQDSESIYSLDDDRIVRCRDYGSAFGALASLTP